MKKTWTCPVCGNSSVTSLKHNTISCTVRCTKCDSSIGLSIFSNNLSVVYSDVPEEKWVTKSEGKAK